MTQFPNYVCELCGARKRKQGQWFLISQDRCGDSLRILFWNEAVAPHPNVWTFCSSEHVREFVSRWLAQDSGVDTDPGTLCEKPLFGLTVQQEEQLRDSLVNKLQVSRAALNAGFADQRESALMVLDAIQAVLESYGPDLESEPEEAIFDA
jgi:hypothetical protein